MSACSKVTKHARLAWPGQSHAYLIKRVPAVVGVSGMSDNIRKTEARGYAAVWNVTPRRCRRGLTPYHYRYCFTVLMKVGNPRLTGCEGVISPDTALAVSDIKPEGVTLASHRTYRDQTQPNVPSPRSSHDPITFIQPLDSDMVYP